MQLKWHIVDNIYFINVNKYTVIPILIKHAQCPHPKKKLSLECGIIVFVFILLSVFGMRVVLNLYEK